MRRGKTYPIQEQMSPESREALDRLVRQQENNRAAMRRIGSKRHA